MVSYLSSLNSLYLFFSLSLYIYVLLFFKLLEVNKKIGCKIENVIGVNFKKLLDKIINLIFKYILNNYFIECG